MDLKEVLKDIGVFVTIIGFAVFYFIGVHFADKEQPIDIEYSIELVNQDSVKIYSHSTEIYYDCTLEDVQDVFIKDNL